MSLRKSFRFILAHVLVLLVVVATVGLIVNTDPFDEDLLPELAQHHSRSVDIDSDENAYPYLWGLYAVSGKSPEEVGMEVVRRLNEKEASQKPVYLTPEEMAASGVETPAPEMWQEEYTSLTCHPRLEIDCAERLLEEIAVKPPSGNRQAMLLARYQGLVSRQRFEETEEADIFSNPPPYQSALRLARLAVADAFVHKSRDAFLATVGDDLRFWRMMLRDARTLLAKMVAVVGIRANLQFIAYAAAHPSSDNQTRMDLGKLLTPLTPEERDISESIWEEQRALFKEWERMDKGMMSLITQPNATRNAYYLRNVRPMLLLAKIDPEHFPRQPFPGADSDDGIGRISPNPYNLGGRLMARLSFAGYYDYIGRVHDVGGMINLVADFINSRLSRDKGELPDASNGTIGFQCLGGRRFEAIASRDVCSIRIP